MKKRVYSVLIALSLLLIPDLVQVSGEESLRWLQTSTDHFTFIYRAENTSSVQELLLFCEDVYDDVARFLGSQPPGTVHCVLQSDYDYNNAYTAAPPAHIVLYITPPKDFQFGAGSESWLKILLTHELTHYIHYRWQGGFFHVLSRIFGEGAEPWHVEFLPLWFVEGLPVNAETLYTRGGRGTSPFYEMLYRAAVLEASLFSPARAAYSSVFPPRGRKYVAGYLLIDHIIRQYGIDAVSTLVREHVKFPFFGVRRIIRKVLGKPYEVVFEEMKLDLYLKSEPYRAIPEGTLLSPDEYANYYGPVVTSSGVYAYRNTLHDESAIVRINPDTGDETVLFRTSLTDPFSYTAAEDGTIVFASLAGDGRRALEPKLISDLYILRHDSSRPERLTRNGHLYHPALSPDGTRLIAVQGIGSWSQLVQVDMQTGAVEALFRRDYSAVYHPAFSPDGTKAAFALNRSGVQDIWIIDMEDPHKSAAPLPGPDEASEYFPRFKDGSTLIFCSDWTGDLFLYEIDLAGSDVSLLVEDPVGAYYGVTYGDSVLYSSYRAKGYTIESKPYHPGEPIAVARSSPGETGYLDPRRTPDIPDQRRFIDLPKPYIWFPLPFYYRYLEPLPITLGAGIFTAGRSVRGSLSWAAAVSTRFDVFQPGALLDLAWITGPVRWGGTFSHEYLWQDDLAFELLYIQGTGDIAILDRTLHRKLDTVLFSLGVQHLHAIYGEQNFSLADSIRGSGLSTSSQMFLSTGLAGLHSRIGSVYDFYPPFSTAGSVAVNLPMLPSPFPPSGVILRVELSTGFPSIFRHQSIKLGIKGGYSNVAGYEASSVDPRGLFSGVWRGERGTYVGALDYNMTLAVLDAPLILGFNLQGISGGFHIETLGGWDVAPAFFSPYRDLYAGLELVFHVGSIFFDPIPLGAGISIRFDAGFQEPVDITQDLRPYFFLGVDSFSDIVAARNRNMRVKVSRDEPGKRRVFDYSQAGEQP